MTLRHRARKQMKKKKTLRQKAKRVRMRWAGESATGRRRKK